MRNSFPDTATARPRPHRSAAIAGLAAALLLAPPASAKNCAELADEREPLQRKIVVALNDQGAGQATKVEGVGTLVLEGVDAVALAGCEVAATATLALESEGQAATGGTLDIKGRISLLTPDEICLDWYNISAPADADLMARAAAIASAEHDLLPAGCVDRVTFLQKTTPPGAGAGPGEGRK